MTATFFVGIGVILEAPEAFREARKEFLEYWSHRKERRHVTLNAFGFPVVTPERKRVPWIAALSVIGWFIVAVGVVGEFWFDDKVSRYDATLQMIDNESLARANTGAGAANERAGEAIENAAAISRDNIRLKGDFDKSVSDSRTEAAKLERANIDVEAKLEQQIKADLDLQASLAPRRLSAITIGVKSNFDELLALGPISVNVQAVPEPETVRAAGRLASFVKVAKWTSSITGASNSIPDGVRIFWYWGLGHFSDLGNPPTNTADFLDWNNKQLELMRQQRQLQDSSEAHAKALAKVLGSFGWRNVSVQPNMAPGNSNLGQDGVTVRPESIIVQVGIKPEPDIEVPATEEMNKILRDMRQRMEVERNAGGANKP
jgi:hypothetical protein